MLKNTTKAGLLFCLISFLIFGGYSELTAQAQTNQVEYSIAEYEYPYMDSYIGSSDYNYETKHYYLIQSYLDQIALNGGGTIRLEKGVFRLNNTLYIPSGTTLILEDGVVLQGKDNAAVMLDFAYGGMNSTDIHVEGEGKAIIDLNEQRNLSGIRLTGNQNVEITGIQFCNASGGNYISVSGGSGLAIRKNVFGTEVSPADWEESAIDEEQPPAVLLGGQLENTLSRIAIEDNVFQNQYGGIGTSTEVVNSQHSGITVSGNTFQNLKGYGIWAVNWKLPRILENRFLDIPGQASVVINGGISPVITENTFDSITKSISFFPYQDGENKIDCTILASGKTKILNNQVNVSTDSTVTFQNLLGKYERWNLRTFAGPSFYMTPESTPYQGAYMDTKGYKEKSRYYYVLRSYVEAAEKAGGGNIRIAKGTYHILKNIYVPSNVEIVLEDGAVLKKSLKSGSTKAIFVFVPPSKATLLEAVGGYEGSHDIILKGEGKASINLQGKKNSFAIIMGHNTNVTISRLKFKNMNNGHFIEMDASQNVLIERCTFRNHVSEDSFEKEVNMKEAINIDTPDYYTNGFNNKWSKHDCTPNLDVVIRNNKFYRLERAIGTHKYSLRQYHTNIQILNNTFKNIDRSPIVAMNWKDLVISGNTIDNVYQKYVSDSCGVYLKGGNENPTITDNTIRNVRIPIWGISWRNNKGGSLFAPIHNTISEENIQDMLKNKFDIESMTVPYIRLTDQEGNTENYEIKNSFEREE